MQLTCFIFLWGIGEILGSDRESQKFGFWRSILRSMTYLEAGAYSEHCETSTMKRFAKKKYYLGHF